MCVIFTVYIFSKTNCTQSGKCSRVYCNTTDGECLSIMQTFPNHDTDYLSITR